VPTPRRKIVWFSVVPDFWKLSEGTSWLALSMLGRLVSAKASPVMTETASGTDCRLSERFCAVTTISPGA